MPEASRYLSGMNPQQAEGVCHTEGPVLILAGAGSGKTRVITHRIAYIIAQRMAKPSEILAMTFTNKAAREMRERVAGLVGRKKAAGITISTFHSFCLAVLRKHIDKIGLRRNFTISSEGDVRTLVQRVLDDIDGPQESFSPALFLEQISSCKNSDRAPEKHRKPAHSSDNVQRYVEWLPEVYERYQSALRAANTLDFDDLLLLTLRLWREVPEVLEAYQTQYRYVMVDEYQDTNQVQYQLLRHLVRRHENLCVVGDDDQSIYAWRGADIRNILDFERDFRTAKIITLDQNYRSTEVILEAANAVIANNRQRREKKLWSALGRGRPIDWIVVGNEEEEAKAAVQWMRHIQNKTGAKCGDFAVLYRSNIQSRPLEIAFRQARIPYQVIGGQDFYERADVKDLIAYLKVIVNPRDEASFLRIINMPRRGIGDKTLHQVHDLCEAEGIGLTKALGELIRRGQAPKQAEHGIQEFLGLISEFRRRFKDRAYPLHELTSDLLDRIAYFQELRRTCKSQQQLTNRWGNVEAVLKAMEAYEGETKKPTLSAFLDQSSLVRDEMSGKDTELGGGVTLMTIHSAKGLEFPFVFLMGIEDGLLPHDKSLMENTLDEERRLFYVALTRGKRHVSLFEALSRSRHGRERMTETSRFAKEIPESLVNKRVLAVREMVEERVDPPRPEPKRKPRRRKALSK